MKLKQIVVSGTVANEEAFIQNSILSTISSDEVANIIFEASGSEFIVRNGNIFSVGASVYEAQITEIATTIVTEATKDFITVSDLTEPVTTIVNEATASFITAEDLQEPVTVSDALKAYIDAKIGVAVENLATKDEVTPLSETQIQSLFDAVLLKIQTDGSGNLTINYNYTMPTPTAKIITPVGTVIEQESFTDQGDGTYRFTFDPTTYGTGNYAIEIQMS